MEETKESGEKGCCSTGKRCCCGKALAAIGLIAIGFAGGAIFARHCPLRMCPFAPAVQTQTQAPAAQPKAK